MGQPEPEHLPLLLRPDLIQEVNRMAAYYRSPEGRAQIAAMSKTLREDPAEQRLSEELEGAVAETPGWEWNEEF